MKEESTDLRQLIRQQVNHIDPQAEVILYGSRARGEALRHSDWDILVLTDYTVSRGMERKFRDVLYDLELETGASISLMVCSKRDWQSKQRITPFFDNVRQEGVKI